MVIEDFNMTDTELEEKFKDKKVLLREDLKYGDSIEGLTVSENVMNRTGKIVTIHSIWNTSKDRFPRFEIYEDNGWSTYNMIMVEAFIEEVENLGNIKIQVGDLCRIKNDYTKEFNKTRRKYNGLKIYQALSGNNIVREEMKGATLIVRDIVNGKALPYYMDDDYKNGIVPLDCLEVIEKDCVNSLKKKIQDGTITDKGKEILDDLDLMDEMISKVNIKDFKKIYAGSVGCIPNNLKGVELILNQWAYNKRHIYKMFGNKFSLVKELEYQKDASSIKQDIESMIREFPRNVLYVPRY